MKDIHPSLIKRLPRKQKKLEKKRFRNALQKHLKELSQNGLLEKIAYSMKTHLLWMAEYKNNRLKISPRPKHLWNASEVRYNKALETETSSAIIEGLINTKTGY